MDEEQSEETIGIPYFKPSFVLIAIDTGPSMFITRENNEDGSVTHCFKDCLTACYEVADSLLFTQNRNSWSQFAVALAYPDDKANFVEFDNNFLDTVKFLHRMSDKSNEELKNTYERKDDLDLGAFLLTCKSKFRNIKSPFYKRTLIFITNDDNPVKNDANRKFTALNEAKSFQASEISVEVVTMRDDFDYSIFFNELYSMYDKPNFYEEVCEDKDGVFEKLSSAIVQRYSKKKYNIYPFRGDPTRYLKCVKMNFIQPAKLYNNAKVSEDGKLLKRVTTNSSSDRTFKVTTTYGYEYKLTMEDRRSILSNDFPVGLSLLYVSNRHTDVGFNVSPPSLLKVDPTEELPFFDQFWQYCIDKNKVLVCLRKYKTPDKIRYVELIPKYANNTKMFLMKHIPFSTEIKYPRKTNIENPITCDDPKKLKCVESLIEQISFDYYPKMLPNPSFGKKKAYVKSKLLDEPLEEVDDVSCNYEVIDKNLEKVVADLENKFHLEDDFKAKKRKDTASGSKGTTSKKAK